MFCFNFIACSYWRKLFTLYFVPHTIPITCDGHDRMNSEQDFFEHSFFEKILLITFYAYKFVNCIPLLLPTTIILRLFYQTFTLLTPCWSRFIIITIHVIITILKSLLSSIQARTATKGLTGHLNPPKTRAHSYSKILLTGIISGYLFRD